MGKFMLNGKQVSEILKMLSNDFGTEVTLEKAMAALETEPKKELVVLFTDNFGHVDVKRA
ncbi:MAG: hypothetical protein ABIG39_03525 [Candidatus Micrarchaeota archaeon]